MSEESQKNDYESLFIREALKDLKYDGICYAYNERQIEAIKKKFPDVHIIKNECGYTLSRKRGKDERKDKRHY